MIDTSREAYQAIETEIPHIQRDVLLMHVSAPDGLTQTELEAEGRSWGYSESTSTLRTRRSELEAKGLIERTDTKRPSASGRASYVFRATAAGILEASPLAISDA